jgi:hypothetical protein
LFFETVPVARSAKLGKAAAMSDAMHYIHQGWQSDSLHRFPAKTTKNIHHYPVNRRANPTRFRV